MKFATPIATIDRFWIVHNFSIVTHSERERIRSWPAGRDSRQNPFSIIGRKLLKDVGWRIPPGYREPDLRRNTFLLSAVSDGIKIAIGQRQRNNHEYTKTKKWRLNGLYFETHLREKKTKKKRKTSWLEMQIAAHALFSRPMGGERKKKKSRKRVKSDFLKIINEA